MTLLSLTLFVAWIAAAEGWVRVVALVWAIYPVLTLWWLLRDLRASRRGPSYHDR